VRWKTQGSGIGWLRNAGTEAGGREKVRKTWKEIVRSEQVKIPLRAAGFDGGNRDGSRGDAGGDCETKHHHQARLLRELSRVQRPTKASAAERKARPLREAGKEADNGRSLGERGQSLQR
jgi:hypothetical protein